MKQCKSCGNKLSDEVSFCPNCGSDKLEIKESKNKNIKNKKAKLIIIAVLIIAVIGTLLLSKDKILYTYYKSKGDNSNLPSTAINYYVDAIKIKYTDDIINEINNRLKEDEDFENTLMKISRIVKESDLKNMYVQIYVSKAKENFNNKNYDTTWKYLSKAQKYDYNIERFEYYSDLVKINNSKEEKKQDIYIYNNNDSNYDVYGYDYYIIPDSSTRYLTKSELYGYDKYTLALIRNEIFARHGYIFKNNEYKNYFSSMPWYHPDSSFNGTLNELNSIEKYNVELIKGLE